MLFDIIFLIVGFALLTKGADFFIEGACAVALRFKIPSIIIGLTIVAMGTSAPEASVSINSALKGINGLAIGNVFGSNICNIFLILGVTALVRALPIKKNTIKYEIPFLCFITVLLFAIGHYYGIITRWSALVLLILFVIFLLYLLKIAKNVEEIPDNSKNLSTIKTIVFLLTGLGALFYGSELTVLCAINIAQHLNISDRIIGLTLVAFGTSLPELVTCVIAAHKNQTDIAIGNIIGSNIFNILFVLGVTGIILPVPFEKNFLFDSTIALLAVVLLFLFTFKSKILSKCAGAIFLIIYLVYLAYLLIR